MNSKLLKYALVIIVIMLFILSLVYFLGSRGPDSDNPIVRQPTPAEQEQLAGTAESFVVLYNSYAYRNFDDIRSLYDSQNPTMQAKFDAYLEQLEQSVAPGFRKNTEVVPGTFRYELPEANTAQAQVQLKVTEYRGNQSSQHQATAYLTLVREYDAWSVNDIRIVKM
jgi:hypothetical protein